MEYFNTFNKLRILDIFIIVLLCFTAFVSVIQVAGANGHRSGPRAFFHRYHDCVVRLYSDGHVISSTSKPENQNLHRENISAEFAAFGQNFVLDLRLNRNLFSGAYVEKVFHSSEHSSNKTKAFATHQDLNHCFYYGHVRHRPDSDVAVSTCHGLRGYITDWHDTYHIEALGGNVIRVFRGRDQRQLPFKCGTEGPKHHVHKSAHDRHRRSTGIHAPYDSNEATRYVELYLVSDYRTYERHGKNATLVVQRSKDIANIVSSLYRQLNIYVALVGVEVWTGGDLVSVTTSADSTMESFLRYRMQRINPYHHNDNAQLITGVFFDNGVVGKAIKGPICTHQFSGGVNMDYGGTVSLVATTIAHEMGHNFGMEHDNDTQCDCAAGRCIMAATSGKISPKRWSSCSHNTLAEVFHLGMDYCLRNIPETLYGGAVCGNGLKEDGEECDCGLVKDCTNRCCDPVTCKLYPLAKCATGKCCNLKTCQLKQATSSCRRSKGECDLPEFCDGKSEYCPNDVFAQDGNECMAGQSYCYKGKCTTHTNQCKLLWGDSGRVSDPICFQQLNMNGNYDGSCGFSWATDSYKRCNKEDVMCGLLHCVHLNEKLMFWQDNLAIEMRATFLTRGKSQYVCRSVILDVGMDMPDPGLVPDGAKCEHNKICIDQKCVALAKLKVKQCPQNCHGHGVCNSEGHCHCSQGYAPPLCDRPGYGGSLDSGPISDKYANNDKLIILLVIFLVVLPLIALIILVYCFRKQLKRYWGIFTKTYARRAKCKTRGSKPATASSGGTSSEGRSGRRSLGVVSQGGGKGPKPPIHKDPQSSNPLLHHQESETTLSKFSPWKFMKRKEPSPALVPQQKETPPPYRPPPPPSRPSSIVKSSSGSKAGNKKVRLSMPIQETEAPRPADAKPSKAAISAIAGNSLGDESTSAGRIVKRDSFRGSQISGPVLVCTTNRNSLVLADGNVDIIGPEADVANTSFTTSHAAGQVRRSQSERGDLGSVRQPLIKSASGVGDVASSAVSSSKFRSRPVPPLPTEEEDDTQPIYTNQESGMGDLWSEIQGSLSQKDEEQLYNNLPIQETAPPCPPRPERYRPTVKSQDTLGFKSQEVSLATVSITGTTGRKAKQDLTSLPSAISKPERPKTPSRPSANSSKITSKNDTAPATAESSSQQLKNTIPSDLRQKILSRSSVHSAEKGAGASSNAQTGSKTNPPSRPTSKPASTSKYKPNQTPSSVSTNASISPNSQNKSGINPNAVTASANRPTSSILQNTTPKPNPVVPSSDIDTGTPSDATPTPSVSSLKAKFNQTQAGIAAESSSSSGQKNVLKPSGAGSKAAIDTSAARINLSQDKPVGQAKAVSKGKLAGVSKAAPGDKSQVQPRVTLSKAVSDKPTVQTKAVAKVVSSRPSTQVKPVVKPAVAERSDTSKAAGGAQRPALPPKPGDVASTTLERKVPKAAARNIGAGSQPKRVQSFRI